MVFAFAGDSTMTRLLAIKIDSVRRMRAQSKGEKDYTNNNFFTPDVLFYLYYYVIGVLKSDKLSVKDVSLYRRKRK